MPNNTCIAEMKQIWEVLLRPLTTVWQYGDVKVKAGLLRKAEILRITPRLGYLRENMVKMAPSSIPSLTLGTKPLCTRDHSRRAACLAT